MHDSLTAKITLDLAQECSESYEFLSHRSTVWFLAMSAFEVNYDRAGSGHGYSAGLAWGLYAVYYSIKYNIALKFVRQ